MKMNPFHPSIATRLPVWAAALLALVLSGCTGTGESADPEPGTGSRITVAAELSGMLYSRAEGSEEESDDRIVRTGQYYLTYPQDNPSGVNTIALVDFDKTTPNGVGIVTIPDGTELAWSKVGGGNTPTFYLDNVPGSLDAEYDGTPGSHPTTVQFAEGNNPFVAGLFDETKNDLLWGTKQVQRAPGRDEIDFDLHHYMSRIRVQVTVDREYALEDELILDGAAVEISSLAQTPLSYNRLDGSLALGDDPVYTTLKLVDPQAEGPVSDWQSRERDPNDPENENITVFTTCDFVLPPQGLQEDEQRPRLTIRLQNGKVYSGILPHAMEVDYPDKENPYPVTLYFLREHILTIRTRITQDPPELVFMPVQVVNWVNKGTFTLEGHQAGIYSEADFENLIRNYENYNEAQLARYGFIADVDDGSGQMVRQWIFNFWQAVELVEADIAGRMVVEGGKLDYTFAFNNYTNLLEGTDGKIRKLEREPGIAELKRILSTRKP